MSEPIRVLQIVTTMNRGGLETMLMNYYRNIDRSKIQFDFLEHRSKESDYDQEIMSLGGKIYRISTLNPFSSTYRKELKQFFKNHPEYKIVHCHLDCMSSIPLSYAKKAGIKVRIAHSHNSNQDKNLKYLLKLFYKRKINRVSTNLFACGDKAGKWMFGKSDFSVINNAINTKDFLFNQDISNRIRQKLGLQNKLVVGHVGRFNKQKNHEKVIDIFNEILKLNNNACLILVGEGNLKEEIKNKVSNLGLSNNVLFLGSRDDVNEIMQAFDVFLFPSLYEGLGIVLIEAQAAGIPCLTSDKVVPIEAKVTSLLNYYPLENNSNLWAKKTLDILTEKYDTYNEIKKAGFDIQNNTKWLEEFYINEYNKYNK